MENLFWILTGFVIGFIAYKTVQMAKENSNTPKGGSESGWGGSSPAGEVPKDVKK